MDGRTEPFRKGLTVSPCDVLDAGFTVTMRRDSMGEALNCTRLVGGEKSGLWLRRVP